MNICPKCGLPKIACTCETRAIEGQRIRVRTIKKKFGKLSTLVEGIDTKSVNIKEVAKKLKNKFSCGGTVRDDGTIELQGNHKDRMKEALMVLGFSADAVDVIG
ncbi:MAG TPA: stress response translation initiation inhibitor YciH [Nanoarchaeota archaeon]|nr:MAG: translation initiation factor 1 [archaeon GW2011_AR6]MBS3082799.1 stress response translation initiation inhibitor YciH [Candidatus Pacearchaeota archaeon]HIH34225.1 stress response translation initiation inhibitor YciH [Nanoarchaeota archaeon]HIH50933.1 stress response translation initiation inhibitor YciH [Nanoarchaeota archaeon]HIH65961.1 stress response translation initiation inhibitor YciH [Nanoarchaeota archaeon]